MFSLNPDEPTFIIGDLNMNLLNKDGVTLKEFLLNNNLVNMVDKPTRVQTNLYKKNYKYLTSRTLIDVMSRINVT